MSGTKFSKFLKFFSKLEYTHVSISLDSDLETMYSFGRKHLYTPWNAGFVTEKPNAGVYAKFNSKCEVLCFEISEDSYEKMKQKIDTMERHDYFFKYNFPGIVYAYFNHEQELNHKFTCTQFVAWLLNNSGLDCLQKDPSIIYPNDYYDIPNVKTTYKGYINSYNDEKQAQIS